MYIKEMAIGPGKSNKFCERWRCPYLVTQRLSEWNYQIQIKPEKEVVVNVSRMEKCHNPPTRKRITRNFVRDTVVKNENRKYTREDAETPCVPGRFILRPLPDEVLRGSAETGMNWANPTIQSITPTCYLVPRPKDRTVTIVNNCQTILGVIFGVLTHELPKWRLR